MLLEVKNLKKHFPVRSGILQRQVAKVHAVDGVSLSLREGRTLGLVGESGCGKSTLGRTLIHLYEADQGSIQFQGEDITKPKGSTLGMLRRQMQMVFQDPFDSLNSRHTVGQIIEEPMIVHKSHTGQERRDRVSYLLQRVGLPQNASERYPHEFSGGQRQRIGIARALALSPRLVICDEPVSALDVSVQAQVLNLLMDLQQEMNLAYLFIAHDLAVVKHVSDDIAVMYLGRIVEYGSAKEVYSNPKHPYTRALIASAPVISEKGTWQPAQVLSGDVPSPISPPTGCRFHTRCPFVTDVCRQVEPELEGDSRQKGAHQVACHRSAELES